ncbi:CAT RNA binding domain-containing protein [Paenibacillus woosongensis]
MFLTIMPIALLVEEQPGNEFIVIGKGIGFKSRDLE